MWRRTGLTVIACLLVVVTGTDRASAAEVVISINKAAQTMSVLIDGAEAYNWVVSTGVGGGPYDGTYRPGRMERKWASRKYGMAPMPYSIFFDGNYAIHGTVKVSQLGRRASKGCVRLHPRDAAVLFELVKREKDNTTIVVDKATHIAARVTPSMTDASPAPALAATSEPASPESVKQDSAKPDLAKPEATTADAAKLAATGHATVKQSRLRPKADVPRKSHKVRSYRQRDAAMRAWLRNFGVARW